MSTEKVVLDYILDVTPDENRHGDKRHVVSVDRICSDTGIANMFIDKYSVSLRDLFNNLDGDPRGKNDYLDCAAAGAMLAIASLHRVHQEMDDEDDYDNPLYEDVPELIEEEFNQTFSAVINEMCSYLFGKHTLTEDFRVCNIEAYEDMYEACENLLWTMVLTLADEVNDIETIAEIMADDPNIYPVARWEEDCMAISFMSTQSRLGNNAFFQLLNRGIVSEQRFHRTDRHRGGHRAVSSNRRTSR